MTEVPDELASLIEVLSDKGHRKRVTVALGLLDRLGSFPHPTVVLTLTWQLREARRGSWWQRLQGLEPPPLDDFGVVLRNTLRKLLAQMSAESLGQLDERMRMEWWDRSPATWGGMRCEEDLVRLSKGDSGVLSLATMHANGHVREAAVRTLGRSSDGASLPFLVLRLNDWVHEVRELAEELVLDRLRRKLDEEVIRCLPLFERLSIQVRAGLGAVPELLDERLASERGQGLLLDGARSVDRAIRRACFRRLMGQRGARFGEAMFAGARDDDLYVRMISARTLLECADEPQAMTWIEAFESDPYGPVRRDCLRARARLAPQSAVPHLQSALWDPSRTVRECAYHFLQGQTSMEEIAQGYRDRLQSEDPDHRDLRIAIESLEGLGDDRDVALIERYLADQRPTVAAIALRCVYHLDPASKRGTVLAMLKDARTSVVRQAVELLADFGGCDDETALARAMSGGAPAHAKRPLMRLVKRVALWRRLEILLGLCTPSDVENMDRVQAELLDWCEEHDHGLQAPRPPLPEELLRARALLVPASKWLSTEACTPLRRILSGYPQPTGPRLARWLTGAEPRK